MKAKFDKYWKEFPTVFCLATIMDPRFKLFAIAEWLHMIAYPIVSLLARDLLTVPASTVALESCFSAGGRVVSEKRANLSPSTIEALICLKDWALADSRKQDAAVDEQQAEELMNIRASRPYWMANSEVEIVGESENETIQS
ncbi:unnamed protein product [Prunus armeniaca]